MLGRGVKRKSPESGSAVHFAPRRDLGDCGRHEAARRARERGDITLHHHPQRWAAQEVYTRGSETGSNETGSQHPNLREEVNEG
ncbi:hypothetical protein UPYG_G00340430 [Umbra pygmaea]|uniref:Uncharacterized protein n=1 Tax=Umbra pygmaea TaxID=75934 RepID=A0ABD0VY11_UMBPY